jgi:hypothetical protein
MRAAGRAAIEQIFYPRPLGKQNAGSMRNLDAKRVIDSGCQKVSSWSYEYS